MELNELRNEINQIDDELLKLFLRRMEVTDQVADYKREHGLPIYQPQREREVLKKVAEQAGDEKSAYARVLFSMLMELSKSSQNKRTGRELELHRRIADAIENTPKLFPRSPMVACQGVEGANSQIACEKMFQNPFILYFKSFESVFSAIEQGLCQYGILPIENSTAGSVKKVYDLMIRHNFSIVRTFRLKIDHNLLAKPGVKLIAVENTAVAAKMVAESDRTDIAAISSRSCMELYGLANLAPSIQDKDNNRTRFICISKNLEIYPGADKTSIMMILPHRPGALYRVLARLYVLGINVTKLESRPIPDRDFEFMFYFDLDTSIYSEEFVQLMCELDELCEEFRYLGSYSEVV